MQKIQNAKTNPNHYLLSLLLTLVGTLLFLVNARGLSGLSGLLLISILLMVTPTLFYIFSERHSLSNAQSLSLLLIPLFVLQYIYYLQAGVPVGFTDPHRHIFTYWNLFTDTGKILFENVQSISLNFVGLYVLFRFLSLVSGSDIVTLAGVIPPFLNILIILAVYLVVARLHEQRTGLLAAMLYGWENMVHILGQEMRTQTMGVLLLFIITALLLIINKKTTRSGVFGAVILLAGLVTTSFVCNFYALLVFSGAVVTVFILFLCKREINWLVANIIAAGLYLCFIVFCLCYLIYVSKGIEPLVAQFSRLIFYSIGQAAAPEYGTIITLSIFLVILGAAALVGLGLLYLLIRAITKWRAAVCVSISAGLLLILSIGVLYFAGLPVAETVFKSHHYLDGMISLAHAQADRYAEIYSDFVGAATYLIWGMLAIPYIYYVFAVLKGQEKNPRAVVFCAAYTVLLLFCMVNRLNSPLNPGRPFVAVLIMLVAAMAYFFINISASVKFRPGKAAIKVTAVLLILCFITANVMKKPDYIIGNKAPLQTIPGEQDLISYWHRDDGQYLVSDFLGETAQGRKVFASTRMQRYPFLIMAHQNNITPLNGIGVKPEYLKKHQGSLILLQDKIYGESFFQRDELPDTIELDQTIEMVRIYTNDDYLLYAVE